MASARNDPSTAEDESASLSAGDAGSHVQMCDECMTPNTPIRPMISSFTLCYQTTEDHVVKSAANLCCKSECKDRLRKRSALYLRTRAHGPGHPAVLCGFWFALLDSVGPRCPHFCGVKNEWGSLSPDLVGGKITLQT